jgi:hypothetical protein
VKVIEERDNREILLRPLREEPQLINKGGVLVVRSQAMGEITGVEKREREARITELMQRAGL